MQTLAKKNYPYKELRLRIKQKLGWLGIPVIIPFRGYGNNDCLYISGCVMEDKGLSVPSISNSRWQNMLAMIKRYIGDQMPHVRVKIDFMGKEILTITNDQGIFHVKLDIKDLILPDNIWQQVSFELLDQISQQKINTSGEVLILKGNSINYGVISDVDDTILISHSTNFIKKLRLMLFKNAITRLPFEGVSAFYSALNKGVDGKGNNPFFFVSSSQWNLYDLLIDFCNFRKIPKGPFLLQDINSFTIKPFKKKINGTKKHEHKIEKIKHILNTFGHLNFILIGDSGQKDAEIYRNIALEFPGRILAIYIRDIRKSKAKKIKIISKTLSNTNTDMLLIKDTVLAAQHAIDNGFIKADALQDVVYEKNKDHFAKIEI